MDFWCPSSLRLFLLPLLSRFTSFLHVVFYFSYFFPARLFFIHSHTIFINIFSFRNSQSTMLEINHNNSTPLCEIMQSQQWTEKFRTISSRLLDLCSLAMSWDLFWSCLIDEYKCGQSQESSEWINVSLEWRDCFAETGSEQIRQVWRTSSADIFFTKSSSLIAEYFIAISGMRL